VIPVVGAVQHYAWGDPEFLPRWFGVEPDGRPWAEWWLGTHPAAPSHLSDGRPLADLTGPLPYLLKVLAAGEPLSLQTHPNADQARRGHAEGRYPDPNPKPELLCALTDVEAFCGIRPVAATLDLLESIGATVLAEVLRTRGPGAALEAIYRRHVAADDVVAACRAASNAPAAWVVELDRRHPGDPSVVATLLLNHVTLQPGEAIRLSAGNLHSYLRGAGVELMGASDNVVRGGLTAKHVDVDDLLAVVDPTPLVTPVLPDTGRYELPEVGIALVRLEAGAHHRSRGHELVIDTHGGAWYLPPGEVLEPVARVFVVSS
jgi:mannose-6-phosphate isomerase